MSNGKQNNRIGWAESFLSWEMNSSGGNDLLWEKLNLKLQASSKKNRMNLIWAAAALFITAGSLILWNYQFKNEPVSSPGFHNHSYVIPNAQFLKTAETGITIVNQPAKKEAIIKKSNIIPIVKQDALAGNDLIVKIVQPVVVDSPKIALSNPSTQQKKIRVVHMNEWFSPPPPTFATSKEENEIPYTPSIWPGKHRGLSPPSLNN
jgi:hypothetical protein